MKLKSDFHPRLIGFCGLAGISRSLLIESLIRGLDQFKIGLIKEESVLTVNRDGGLSSAEVIYSRGHLKFQGESYGLEKEFFKDCELVFVEGYDLVDYPKFLVIDQNDQTVLEYQTGKIPGAIGVIQMDGGADIPLLDLPVFHQNDIEGIRSLIFHKMNESLEKVSLQGLVLAGGRSLRMGQDKALLNYQGRPHARQLWETLEQLGIKSFISCRPDQLERQEMAECPMIPDRFLDFGPLGGILSAMAQYPNTAWIVIACDLPFITTNRVLDLIRERDPLKQATAYFNYERKQFEPLFAIYEPRIYSRMLHFLGEGLTCPQKVLFNSAIKKLPLAEQSFLANANTPEDRKKIISMMEGMNL